MIVASVVFNVTAVMLLSICNRIRGGFGGDEIRHTVGNWWKGRIASTIAWGLPFGLIGWTHVGLPWPWALAAGVAAAIGCCAGQGGVLGFLPWAWSAWVPEPLRSCIFGKLAGLSMGHRPGGAVGVAAWVGMSSWSVQRVVGPCLVLWWAGLSPWPLLAAGAATPLLYELVWHVPGSWLLPGAGYGEGPTTGYDRPELAEWLVGGAMAVGYLLR